MIFLLMIESEEDRRKFVMLYGQYKHLMHWIAREILKDDYLAEDMVHDAFERVAQHMEKIDEAISPKTKRYLYVITKNLAIDYVRMQSKRYESELAYTESMDWRREQEIPSFQTPEDGEIIMKALKNLPDIYSTVFILKYIDCLENAEIAELLCIREVTVRQRLARGKLLLREEFERLRKQAEEGEQLE